MKVKRSVRNKAAEMQDELIQRKQSVILIPAPEPRHSTHMIRVVEMRPPEWFSEFSSRYPRQGSNKKYKKFRSKINRKSVLSALDEIKRGYTKTTNARRLHRYIQELLENELEQIPF